MSSFKVTLVSPDGVENVIQCPDDQYIVDVNLKKRVLISHTPVDGSCCSKHVLEDSYQARLIKRINHSSMMNRSKMDS